MFFAAFKSRSVPQTATFPSVRTGDPHGRDLQARGKCLLDRLPACQRRAGSTACKQGALPCWNTRRHTANRCAFHLPLGWPDAGHAFRALKWSRKPGPNRHACGMRVALQVPASNFLPVPRTDGRTDRLRYRRQAGGQRAACSCLPLPNQYDNSTSLTPSKWRMHGENSVPCRA
jgi:hypothetical protein